MKKWLEQQRKAWREDEERYKALPKEKRRLATKVGVFICLLWVIIWSIVVMPVVVGDEKLSVMEGILGASTIAIGVLISYAAKWIVVEFMIISVDQQKSIDMAEKMLYRDKMVEVLPIATEGRYEKFMNIVLRQHASFYAIEYSSNGILICIRFNGKFEEKYHYFDTREKCFFSKSYEVKNGEPISFRKSELAEEVLEMIG